MAEEGAWTHRPQPLDIESFTQTVVERAGQNGDTAAFVGMKMRCDLELSWDLYGPPRRVNCGQAVLIIVFITVVMFTMAV